MRQRKRTGRLTIANRERLVEAVVVELLGRSVPVQAYLERWWDIHSRVVAAVDLAVAFVSVRGVARFVRARFASYWLANSDCW